MADLFLLKARISLDDAMASTEDWNDNALNPTLSVGAGVDHLVNHKSEDDFNQTEWGVQGLVTFPLLQGGAKFAGLRQAHESLASLRTQRLATAQQIERTIRAAFGRASGSFENVGFSGRQVEAAKRNFDLVDRSYTLGVASILDLLDAQAQLLQAKLALNDATYGFLADLVAAERAMSFYAFLQAPAEVDELLDELEQQLAVRP